jgi:hypothetical protein
VSDESGLRVKVKVKDRGDRLHPECSRFYESKLQRGWSGRRRKQQPSEFDGFGLSVTSALWSLFQDYEERIQELVKCFRPKPE